MDDLIRRSDVNFPDAQKPDINGELTDFQCGYNAALSKMKTRISNIPAVDAVEVRHGRWEGDYPQATFRLKRCSVCETLAPEGWYCFFCGAKMDDDI